MTSPNQSENSLRTDLTSHGDESRKSPPSPRTVQPTFKKILRDTVENYPADTRLPPIRDLGKQLGISLVTAQRIVTELIQDGVLYSRPRSGVFVADRSTPKQPPLRKSYPKEGTTRTPGVFESSFTFGTGSQEQFQQPLWENLIQRFCQKYPNTSPKIEHGQNPSTTTDAYERLDWNKDWAGDDKNLLNLSKSAPANLAKRSTPEGLIPLYHRSNFLFYHPKLLKRCGIEPPAYRTFSEQLRFLQEAAPKLEAKGFDPLPYSVQQPITLLGSRHLESYFHLVYDQKTDPSEREEFIRATGEVLQTCRSCQRAPGVNNPIAEENRNRFLRGKEIPFFLGHSVDFWRFTEEKLTTPIQAYPMLSSDDTLFLWPMVGAASSHSKSPVEVLRFLNFLISDEAQASFAKTGAFGADLNPEFSPTTTASPDWFAETLSRSRPMRLASPELFYLAIRILNNELWHALLDHVSVDQAVEEALQLGKVFTLQSRQSSQQNPESSR
ncbi:GntR family transcriptional regulator [Puniceicoccus vermicola]|uniref:GntR family transcriptional regulator n=1 Tax=Puniceicoccus vermicola TaxID=388746 RepID=A0A7X1B0G3_9BACT|nr:GntR family transcriptional regulator [Puniceicoccus vermicola]MBC2603346.1 GntR family transcriptional regulator [Puniceicoccus vermicola]